MGNLLAAAGFVAAVALGIFFSGIHTERMGWEAKTMGDFCDEGRQWACRLHPKCSMNALICFGNPQFTP